MSKKTSNHLTVTRYNPVIPYDLARMAKDRGFNWKTELVYKDGEDIDEPSYQNAWSQDACWSDHWVRDFISLPNFVPAPSHQVLQHWFKEVHGVDVWAQPYTALDVTETNKYGELDDTYSYFIFRNGEWVQDGCDYPSLRSAFEAGLYHALTHIPKQN